MFVLSSSKLCTSSISSYVRVHRVLKMYSMCKREKGVNTHTRAQRQGYETRGTYSSYIWARRPKADGEINSCLLLRQINQRDNPPFFISIAVIAN